MQQIRSVMEKALFQETLSNGLRVNVMKKPGFQKKYAIFAVQYGSFDSQFEVEGKGIVHVPDGIAHFLEHKLFEEKEGHVFERFAQFGANVNAFTSYTMTSYLFSTTEYFLEALAELLRFVQTPYLTKENVEKEKGIIEQELRMYADHPARRIYSNLLSGLYHKHPIVIDVGGTVDSIQKITVDLLLECYRLFYQPKNMVLFVIGDVDSAQIINLVREHTANWQYQEKEIKRIYPKEPPTIARPFIEQKLHVSRPRYYLGFKDSSRQAGKELLKQQFAMHMIWRKIAAKSSLVYERLYNSGLIDDSFGASFQAAPQYAFSIVGGETDQPKKLDETLRKAIINIQKEQLNTDDVDRMKRYVLGNYLASFNSLEYIANSFVSHLFNGTNFLDIPEVINDLTVDDVNQFLIEGLNLERTAVSLLMPE